MCYFLCESITAQENYRRGDTLSKKADQENEDRLVLIIHVVERGFYVLTYNKDEPTTKDNLQDRIGSVVGGESQPIRLTNFRGWRTRYDGVCREYWFVSGTLLETAETKITRVAELNGKLEIEHNQPAINQLGWAIGAAVTALAVAE